MVLVNVRVLSRLRHTAGRVDRELIMSYKSSYLDQTILPRKYVESTVSRAPRAAHGGEKLIHAQQHAGVKVIQKEIHTHVEFGRNLRLANCAGWMEN